MKKQKVTQKVTQKATQKVTQKVTRKIETSRSGIVRYGLASKPILELSQDAVCKAMLFIMLIQLSAD